MSSRWFSLIHKLHFQTVSRATQSWRLVKTRVHLHYHSWSSWTLTRWNTSHDLQTYEEGTSTPSHSFKDQQDRVKWQSQISVWGTSSKGLVMQTVPNGVPLSVSVSVSVFFLPLLSYLYPSPSVLVFYCCWNTLPQTPGLKTTQMCYRICQKLEMDLNGQKSTYWQGCITPCLVQLLVLLGSWPPQLSSDQQLQ